MAPTGVILILGSGPRVGASVAKKFADNGYKVALTSRSGTGGLDSDGYLSLNADLSKPDVVPELFHTVKAEFNAYPEVVVYNAAALAPPATQDSALSIPLSTLTDTLNVNTISAYAAAQEAIKGWETLPQALKKTFIYTGNWQNTRINPMPLFLGLGIGKAASAHWVGFSDAAYQVKGYRFFYCDERQENGISAGQQLSGPAHAEFYAQLVNHQGGVPWLATFVKDKGYVKLA